MPENVKELRQTILQLAVMGKLVKQSNDEDVDAILLAALEQQAAAIARGEHKKAKGVQPVPKGGNAPESWRLVRLADVLVFGPRNGLSPRGVEEDTGTRVLTLSATTTGTFEPSYCKNVTEDIDPSSHLWLRQGDVLIQRGNSLDYVGVAALVDRETDRLIYPDLMMKVRCSQAIEPPFLTLSLNSPEVRAFFRANASGTSGSMPKIAQGVVNNTLLALPPLSEQKRIVEKVNQLMAFCDDLEANLTYHREQGTKLMQAVVESLVA